MADLIIVAVVGIVVAAAGRYIYKEKKHGAKCIGCPASKSCRGAQGCGCCGNTNK